MRCADRCVNAVNRCASECDRIGLKTTPRVFRDAAIVIDPQGEAHVGHRPEGTVPCENKRQRKRGEARVARESTRSRQKYAARQVRQGQVAGRGDCAGRDTRHFSRKVVVVEVFAS